MVVSKKIIAHSTRTVRRARRAMPSLPLAANKRLLSTLAAQADATTTTTTTGVSSAALPRTLAALAPSHAAFVADVAYLTDSAVVQPASQLLQTAVVRPTAFLVKYGLLEPARGFTAALGSVVDWALNEGEKKVRHGRGDAVVRRMDALERSLRRMRRRERQLEETVERQAAFIQAAKQASDFGLPMAAETSCNVSAEDLEVSGILADANENEVSIDRSHHEAVRVAIRPIKRATATPASTSSIPPPPPPPPLPPMAMPRPAPAAPKAPTVAMAENAEPVNVANAMLQDIANSNFSLKPTTVDVKSSPAGLAGAIHAKDLAGIRLRRVTPSSKRKRALFENDDDDDGADMISRALKRKFRSLHAMSPINASSANDTSAWQ